MSEKVENRLAQVYSAASIADLSNSYDDWAESYDADMLATGYAHPAIICGLAARFIPDLNASILDAGVGTGAVGTLLSVLGFANLHGIDMSQAMLAKARARGVYQSLHQGTLGAALDYPSAHFACILSTGTFTTGHAPASAFDELTRILRPGGKLIFTVGEKVWRENGFAEKLESLCQNGKLNPLWQSPVYHPMPHSKTESHFTTRAYAYQRS